MAPKSVRKQSPKKKSRISAGVGYDFNKWNCVGSMTSRWVGFQRGSKFFCESCFTEVSDPIQHMNKTSACGQAIAIGYLLNLYEENYSGTDDFPRSEVVAAMLEDPGCPLKPKDILCQAETWDPTTAFRNPTDGDHTCAPAVVATNFHAMYTAYATAHPNININPHVPVSDILHKAAQRATSTMNYPMWLQRYFNEAVETEITRRIAAGDLQRTNDV